MTDTRVPPGVTIASEYATVWRYDPLADQHLADSDVFSSLLLPQGNGFTPRDAAIRWSATSYGLWQEQQTARYSLFHADLDERLVPEGSDSTAFKQSVLRIIGASSLLGFKNIDKDLNPNGHGAEVLHTHDDLVFDGRLRDISIHPQLIDDLRHVFVTHDIGEVTHGEIEKRFGWVVGDIASTVGKTPEERAQEMKIYAYCIDTVFADQYSVSRRDRMKAFVSHAAADDPELQGADALKTLTHHINSARTATNIGHFAGSLVVARPDMRPQANILSLLAGNSETTLRNDMEGLAHRLPGVSKLAQWVIDDWLMHLRTAVHCRDEDDEWVTWRQSDVLSELFGSYDPVVF